MVITRNPEITELNEDALLLEESEARMAKAYKSLAQRDLIAVQHIVLEAYVKEIDFVKSERPELNELETMIVAKRLLHQRLRCYEQTVASLTS